MKNKKDKLISAQTRNSTINFSTTQQRHIQMICYSAIRQALTSSCKFEAALLVCNKYQLDKAGVYASWGFSELAIGGQDHFKLARDKFKHYYQVSQLDQSS